MQLREALDRLRAEAKEARAALHHTSGVVEPQTNGDRSLAILPNRPGVLVADSVGGATGRQSRARSTAKTMETKMILCQRGAYWYLARPWDDGSIILTAGLNMQCEPGFVLNPDGRYQRQLIPNDAGLVFYPEALYRGVLLQLGQFDQHSSEPLVWGQVYDCRIRDAVGMEGQQAFVEALKNGHGGRWDVHDGMGGRYFEIDSLTLKAGPKPEHNF